MDYIDAKLNERKTLQFLRKKSDQDIYDKPLSHFSPRLDYKTKRNFISHPHFYSGVWKRVVVSSLIHVKIAVINPKAIKMRNVDTMEINNKSAEAY